jgi:hypothetical protein
MDGLVARGSLMKDGCLDCSTRADLGSALLIAAGYKYAGAMDSS